MNDDSPPARNPAHLAPARGRQIRSTSDCSPTRQRNTDDLLSNLTPRTVVDAFRNPSGSLKASIEAATPAEQAFALRVAVASNSIHEWLGELSVWPWPAGGGSAGFEMPAAKRKRLSDAVPPAHDEPLSLDQEYNGSLPAADVVRYERRIDDIAQGLEELDIEEIKSQVLNNHIMPLSRPGTPILDSGRSTMSLSSIARLDDLTAIVTATTVQALPNLSRLTRLMGAWNFRLLVLRKIPVFLTSIADAEVALQSGWNAISPADDKTILTGTASAALSREDFDVMKSVLGRKVAKAGRDLDAMLDVLEGQPDTLPEDWIDRVDTLEHGYGEWTVACDRKVKEADLVGMAPQVAAAKAPEQPLHQERNGTAAPPPTNGSLAPESLEEEQPKKASPLDSSSARELSPGPDVRPPVIKIHPTAEDETPEPEEDYPDTDNEFDESNGSNGVEPPVVLVSESIGTYYGNRGSHKGVRGSPSSSESELSDILEHDVSPTQHRGRRDSSASESSTVLHGAPSMFTDSFSSDLLDQGTPERPRHGIMHRDDEISGLDSFRSSTRSLSVSFNDKPTITELPSFPSPPGTPTKSAILEDDEATEPGTPPGRSIPGMDDQLQQQISEILESVPAKIRLTAEPPAVNLNPPDFKMPTARKSSRPDAIPRSQSNLSMRSAYSRSGTPSFTLAPARNSRPRHQRGNQEIKLYHLSRSNGEAPIKLFIRCVGEHGERVMVRVGGGWADLGEYLKEYASHHLRRSAGAGTDGKIEVKDIPRTGAVRPADATPPSRPTSAMDAHSPISPLKLRKTRRPPTADDQQQHQQQQLSPATAVRPKTPLANAGRLDATPPSDASSSSARSRSSSRISWDEEDGAAALGMAGPRAKQIEMLSEESRAWVESVKEKVRIASGERKQPLPPPLPPAAVVAEENGGGGGGLEASLMDRGGDGASGRRGAAGMFGEMGKVGSTKRLFRRG
ncbi:hypothetical protein C8A01DRAFT_37265 [Parachaetomium inaequale]|uniref:GAR domain-containing protein n=1 Tax=Parachaetomium inaequale TaxID=2588326 RepID=A0AAN6PD71_9PEZI|nr:hypothetical protein C8A01DRAFT_37265 [Parachaetomium inaequale]